MSTHQIERPTSQAPHIAYALAAQSLLAAARRAHDDGLADTRDQLLDHTDRVLELMVEFMPADRRET